MRRAFLLIMMFAAFSLLVAGASWAQEQESEDIKDLKKKVEELEKAQKEQEERISHLDKHILHAEEAVVRSFKGLDFAMAATGVLQGTAGVEDSVGRGDDRTDASVSFDIEVQSHIGERGLAFVALEAGKGSGIDGKVPTLSGVNFDAIGDKGLGLLELWYEHKFGSMNRVRVGQIDVTSDFDTNWVANNETTQFLSRGFINNLAVEFPEGNGFGAMFWTSPGESVDVGVTVADALGGWDDVFDNGFYMVEVRLKPKTAVGQGNYRPYLWVNAKPHQELDNPANRSENGWGFGVSADQAMGDLMTVFARLGFQDEDVYQISYAWSAGFRYSMESIGREDDAFGVAVGAAAVGDDYEDANPGISHDDEYHAEAYYTYMVNEHLFISPDLQWVKNPGGNGDRDSFAALGVRAQLEF